MAGNSLHPSRAASCRTVPGRQTREPRSGAVILEEALGLAGRPLVGGGLMLKRAAAIYLSTDKCAPPVRRWAATDLGGVCKF